MYTSFISTRFNYLRFVGYLSAIFTIAVFLLYFLWSDLFWDILIKLVRGVCLLFFSKKIICLIRIANISVLSYQIFFFKLETLRKAAADYGINHGIYGDIDIQSHRDWEEKVSNLAGEG
jgi:hypothetical protein